MLSKSPALFFSSKQNQDNTISPVSVLLKELYRCDDKALVTGKWDEVVGQCILIAKNLNDREMLRQLAFVLFSGSRVNYNTINQTLLRKQWCLILFLSDEKFNLNDTIFILRDCFNTWKEIKNNHIFKKNQQTATLSSLTSISDKSNNILPDDHVLVTHGGGYYHIKAFLEGESLGYKLEGNCGLGLQVHVSDHGKTLHYSNSIAWLHLDTPAFLMARIKAKYLYIQNRNSYEAALRSEWTSKLTDVQVVRMPHFWIGNGVKSILGDDVYPEYPELKSCIRILLEQFEKNEKINGDRQLELWRMNKSDFERSILQLTK